MATNGIQINQAEQIFDLYDSYRGGVILADCAIFLFIILLQQGSIAHVDTLPEFVESYSNFLQVLGACNGKVLRLVLPMAFLSLFILYCLRNPTTEKFACS